MHSRSRDTLPQMFAGMKADYAAARPSKFRRTRTGLGGSGDAHYYTEHEFRQLREQALAMERDDAVIGQMFDRAADNRVGSGFDLQPDTGDDGIDQEIDHLWAADTSDPAMIDIAGRFNFAQMEWLLDRTSMLAGDMFALPLESGHLQLFEPDRCLTPMNAQRRRNVIHGVHLDALNRPREYWFANEWDRTSHVQRVSDVTKYPAFVMDPGGAMQPNVFHIFDPRRSTQTRGITALHAIMDVAGMFEDLQFANVLKAQLTAMITYIVKRMMGWTGNPAGPAFGEQTTETLASGHDETSEKVKPTLAIRLQAGEDLAGFAPAIPNETFFDHVRLILRMIGCNIGMPLELVLLDTTQTTFHGYRGALDQARIGFTRGQANLEARFHRPCYHWKLRSWIASGRLKGPAVAKLQKNGSLFRHIWGKPGWRYVEPKTDAEADSHRIEKLLAAPSDIAGEGGKHHRSLVRRIVRDNALTIREAEREAKKLREEDKIEVSWRQVLSLTLPERGIPDQWAEQDREAATGKSEEDRERERQLEDERKTGTNRNGAAHARNRLAPLLNGSAHADGGGDA